MLNDDPYECEFIPCNSDVAEAICPRKCYCERPSIVTKYCMPCYNNGILNTTSCQCACKKNYYGPRCQYTPNPCVEDDLPECANVNCWQASDAKFFKCQRKCLCCGNKKCFNSGTLTTDSLQDPVNNCKCKCTSQLFNEALDCQ